MLFWTSMGISNGWMIYLVYVCFGRTAFSSKISSGGPKLTFRCCTTVSKAWTRVLEEIEVNDDPLCSGDPNTIKVEQSLIQVLWRA
ncbi:hypothetical protein HDV62DRAFT_212595 [Trichoderma sp. SZMC 28011]